MSALTDDIIEQCKALCWTRKNFGDTAEEIHKAKILPDDWYAREDLWGQEEVRNNLPKGAIKIGWYKVRSGDPTCYVYLVPRNP